MSEQKQLSEAYALLQTYGRHLKGCEFEGLSWAEMCRSLDSKRGMVACNCGFIKVFRGVGEGDRTP